MNRLIAVFSVTAVLSAALVAAAATGAFSGGGATNAARPKAVKAKPGAGDDLSVEDVRAKALDALKEARDNGTIPREEGQTPSEDGFVQGPDIPRELPPAVVATSPEEEAADAQAPAPAGPQEIGPDGEPIKKGMSPQRIKEVVEERIANDPYRAPAGPSVSTDRRSGTTIINTSPH